MGDVDAEGRKAVAAVDGALLVVVVAEALLVKQVAAQEDNWEDVGGFQLEGVGEEVREKKAGFEAVVVAAGAQGWS